jgi:perosamine synthetase
VEAGRFRQAVQDILRAEGLYVKLSQRTPLPGQALFQIKRGFGKGYPWIIGRDVPYRIEDYPVTLDVIDRSLALDVRYFNPLVNEDVQKMVVDTFGKVWDRLDEVQEYARKIEYVPLWDQLSKLPPKEQIVEYVAENLDRTFQHQAG